MEQSRLGGCQRHVHALALSISARPFSMSSLLGENFLVEICKFIPGRLAAITVVMMQAWFWKQRAQMWQHHSQPLRCNARRQQVK